MRECFSPPASLETQSSQRENMFSFLVTPVKLSCEFNGARTPEKKRSYSVIAVMIVAAHIRTQVNNLLCRDRHAVICFPSSLPCAMRSLLLWGQRKTNQKLNLCDLCGFAVNRVLSKTLLGSPFKPPFLGVVEWGRKERVADSIERDL